jgi:DNA-binding transcriptional ArsR family regulator
MTPGTMAAALAVPAATLSFHLKELAHAGLVTQERASRHLIYRAAYPRMDALLAYLTQNCCQGVECLDAGTVACGR